MKKKYYTSSELAQGIKNDDGIEIIPPIEIKTQNALRSKRKIGYHKISGRIYYKLEQIESYIKSNEVEVVA